MAHARTLQQIECLAMAVGKVPKRRRKIPSPNRIQPVRTEKIY